MDLVVLLQKEIRAGEVPTKEQRAELAVNLTRLSPDGADPACKIILAYKNAFDNTKEMGQGNIPYYGKEIPHKADPNLADVQFQIDDLPDQLILILIKFLQKK